MLSMTLLALPPLHPLLCSCSCTGAAGRPCDAPQEGRPGASPPDGAQQRTMEAGNWHRQHTRQQAVLAGKRLRQRAGHRGAAVSAPGPRCLQRSEPQFRLCRCRSCPQIWRRPAPELPLDRLGSRRRSATWQVPRAEWTDYLQPHKCHLPVWLLVRSACSCETNPSALHCTACSLAGDPLLSLISTRLATRQDRSSAAPSSPTAPSASGLSSDGAPSSTRLRLPAAVQQWEVHWEELSLVRSVGRGSYGRVYLANWRETPVAVKVGSSLSSRPWVWQRRVFPTAPLSMAADLWASHATWGSSCCTVRTLP